MKNRNLHSIKAVSEQTGLSTFLIRAWENRYNAVTPKRTDSNRRLYSEADIEKLKLLNEAVKCGYLIRNVANLSAEELKELLNRKRNSNVEKRIEENLNSTGNTDHFKSALNAIKELDAERLERLLINAGIELSEPELLYKFIIPLMFTIGELWQAGEIRIAHEHLASEVVCNFLINRIRSHRPNEFAPVLVVATPQGQLHEIGSLAAGVTAASLGWKIVHIGSDLPVREIAYSVRSQKAKALILGIIYPTDDLRLINELKELAVSLDPEVRMLVTGNGAAYYTEILDEIGARIINTPRELIDLLDEARKLT